MQKIKAIFPLSCFCFLLLQACHQKNNSEKARQVFHFNFSSGNLESIDPAYAKNLYDMWMVHMVYNTLFETDEQLHLVSSIAANWNVSPDGLIFTIHLRNDVFFQDNKYFPNGKGRKMIAADVVYSFNRIIDPVVASPGAWIFNDRVAKENPFVAMNDSTVEIHLQKPFRPLLQILSMPYCSIVPKEIVERYGKDFRAHPCGTGPFQFQYWDEGNVLIFHKNKNYWEKDSAGNALPYLDAVQASFVDNKATEFLLFMQKKLEFVNSIDGSFKDMIISKNGELKKAYRDKFHLSISTYLNDEYIGFLTDSTNPLVANSPVKNVLVRRAINYAIDRKKICTYFRNGAALPATSGFIPAGMPGYDSTGNYGYNYNPKKALKLLAEAGFPNGKGMRPITILTRDNYLDIVNFIVSELNDIGIPAKAETMQPNILRQQMMRSQVMMFRAQWIADYPDAETYLVCFNSHFPAPPNYTRYKNKTFDKWYEQSLNEPDSVRWKLYQKMDSLAMSEAPVLNIYYDMLLHFTQNYVSGFSSNAMNLIDIKKVQIKK